MQLHEVIRRYQVYLCAVGISPLTFSTMKCKLRLFEVWAEGCGVTTLEQLTVEIFWAYQEALMFRLTRQGRPITMATQRQHLMALRAFGRYLVEQDFLISDPARKIKLPRALNRLPRMIPDVHEAVRLMASAMPNKQDHDRLQALSRSTRDRAILELLYSTGLRRGEASHLNVADLDLVGGYVWVREGKGKKDRVVPLGHTAVTALTIYLDAVRSTMIADKEEDALFLNRYGGRLLGRGIYEVVRKAVVCARLSRKITPHSLRHAAATHMLQNGAPIRHLQEFLGHASIDTTQVYTRITIPELKATHAKYHPREKEEE